MGARIEHEVVEGVEVKLCSRCKRWLSLGSFSTDRSCRDGLSYFCRKCASIATGHRPNGVLHYAHRVVEGIELKRCCKCGNWLELDSFRSVGLRGDTNGLCHWCKTCVGRYDQEWRGENPEQIKAYNHARRARKVKADGSYTGAEFVALCERYGNRCLCPDMDHAGILVPDHIVPLSAGGSNDISNIQPLCAHHNGVKGTKTIDYRAH